MPYGAGAELGRTRLAAWRRSSNVSRLLGVGLLENKLLNGGGLLSSSMVVVTAIAPAVITVSIDDDDINEMFHLVTK